MSRLRRLALSSGLTPLFKLVPPVLWLIDGMLLTALLATGFAGWRAPSLRDPTTLLAPLAWMALGILLFALPAVWWWAMRMRAVATDGTSLFIGGPSGEAEVKLSEIVFIGEWHSVNLCTVTVRLAQDTPAGQTIRFLARTSEAAPPGEPHPVVEMLRELSSNAQPVRTRTRRVPGEQFGQRHAA